MTKQRLMRALTIAALAAMAAIVRTGRVTAQAGEGQQVIPSLTEPREGLRIARVSERTGYVSFAASRGQGILLAVPASASAEERALIFADLYGASFGLEGRSQLQLMRAAEVDALGIEHVRFQQVYQGIPVTGGQFLVHLRGSRVVAANGSIATKLPDTVAPSVTPAAAWNEAKVVVEKHIPAEATNAAYSEPRLEIFDRGMLELSAAPSSSARLAWFVEASGSALREFIWVDAETGVTLLHFSQLTDAKSREVYNLNHATTLPGTLVRSEGGAATGDADTDNAYDYSGATFDYFWTTHARDSYDNAGATIRSSVHYGTNYQNAYWNGSQMVYGDGFSSADDVVAHELTHAVTERTANLFYYAQSGALNESFSDVFGETVDLTDGLGNDTAGLRWLIGEDLPIGVIRHMMTPTAFGDPGKTSDAEFYCGLSDNSGVHTNSGVPNHAYALMVDGGTYNGVTVVGIGLTKAGKIEYRALTTYLTSGSGFKDASTALNQSCSDLVGTAGITSADCTQVTNALLAVGMAANLSCTVQAPALCTTASPVDVFFDDFETSLTNWTTAGSTGTGSWTRTAGSGKDGSWAAYGTDPVTISDVRLAMTSSVSLPSNARLYFDHSFTFEHQSSTGLWDGAVLEYSANAGSTWNDAGSLIEAGRTYGGTISSSYGNPLGGRSGFVGSSWGYTGTRVNLATLAGQAVRFRFRIGSDSSGAAPGWAVDGVRIYTCGVPILEFTTDKSTVSVPEGLTETFQVKLNQLPPSDVTATVQKIVGGDPDITVQSGASLTFTTENWNTYQTVTLAAAEDADTMNGTATIRISATGVPDKDVLAVEADNDGVLLAAYDSTLKVPVCATAGIGCDSASLLNGRDTMSGGAEPNQPNTLFNSCADGTAGTYHLDESVDRIRLWTVDGSPLAPGKTVRIEATVWAFSTTSDKLDLYYTGNASQNPPSWTLVTTLSPTTAMAVSVLTADYVLPASGAIQAVRARFRWGGSVAACGAGSFNDHDDLAFKVGGSSGQDFTGDGKSDILWRHATQGDVWLWPMNGPARTAETYVRTVPDTNWEIRGLGDHTGEGKADILWRNKTTGMIYLWPMDGSVPTAETYVGIVDPAYDIVGTGDFDGDGKTDILWRHTTTGAVWIWLMNGATPLSQVYVDAVDPGYLIKGVGDLDGDHKADIVWHHATTGAVWAWLMNGTTRLSQTWVATVPDTGYQIQQVADFDGNGKADILWWHATSGQVWMWTMNGATRLAQTYVATVADTNYRIVGSGDYDGDGEAGILWHHATRGEVWMWLMDGPTRLSETWVGTVSNTGYQIVKVK